MTTTANARRDFNTKTLRSLAARGIELVGVQLLPGSGPMPWANAEAGYVVNHDGVGKVWTFSQVLKAAA